jgi:hypothetical protein
MKDISWITSASVESGAEVYLMLKIREALISNPTIRLLVAEMRMKIVRVQQISDKAAKQSFVDHLKQLDFQKNNTTSDINTAWVRIKEGIVVVSEKHLGYLHPQKKD